MHKNERKFIMKLRVENNAFNLQTTTPGQKALPYRVNGVFQTIQEISLPPDPLRRGEPYPNQINSNQIQPNQNKSNQINSNQIQPNQRKSNQFKLVKKPWMFLSGWRRSCQFFFTPKILLLITMLHLFIAYLYILYVHTYNSFVLSSCRRYCYLDRE